MNRCSPHRRLWLQGQRPSGKRASSWAVASCIRQATAASRARVTCPQGHVTLHMLYLRQRGHADTCSSAVDLHRLCSLAHQQPTVGGGPPGECTHLLRVRGGQRVSGDGPVATDAAVPLQRRGAGAKPEPVDAGGADTWSRRSRSPGGRLLRPPDVEIRRTTNGTTAMRRLSRLRKRCRQTPVGKGPPGDPPRSTSADARPRSRHPGSRS